MPEPAIDHPITAWESLLGELEARLAHWQGALDGANPYPDELSWPHGLGRCPAGLEARAKRILAAQRDLHERVAARHGALGALLRRSDSPRSHAPPALFVDQHC